MIQEGSFINIQAFMRNSLDLKGNELLIYALIFGFSQDGESEFTGSINYICEWIGTSRPTVIKALQALTEKGLIIKRVETISNVTFNRYSVNLPLVKKLYGGSKETLQGVVKKFNGGSKETLPNNINNNINNNLKERKKERSNSSYDAIIAEYTQNEKLKEALLEFVKMRKLIKNPLTDYALKNILKKLDRLASNDIDKTAIVNQSILHNWQSVFELKDRSAKTASATADTRGFDEIMKEW